MNSVLRVNKGLVSCKYIDVFFHMLVGLAIIILSLSMHWAQATYASTGAIFQRVDDIALAPLKSSYLIEDKTLFEWALSLSVSPLSSGSSGGDDDGDDGNEPEPLNVVYGKEIWLAQVLAERLLNKTLENKRRLLRIVHKKLQRAIAEGNSGLVKILGDRLMLIEVELDELERAGQQLDPVVLSRVRAAFVSDQQELQGYDDWSLRLAQPEHTVTVNVDPDSLIIRSYEGRQVPNSDTQTDHSEQPSASQPSTSRQAPVSGSGLGERQYARCLREDDGGNGNPSRNGHTRNNHCPMCNNGPCEHRVEDNSGYPASYDDKGITDLPNEIVIKILSNLDIKTISVCRRVNSNWQALINESHLPALAFCRALHYRPIPQTVKRYHSFTRGWLTGFGDKGKKLADELDRCLEDKYFPEMSFFAVAEVLARTRHLTCQEVFATRNNWWRNVHFSPDGHHLVTVFNKTAKIWGFLDGKWQEKAKIEHEDSVININTNFSPDGKHLVTSSRDNTAKIWGLVDDNWQEKAKIENENSVINADFSPDGQHLVTASCDNTPKIWGLVDGKWQEKAKIEHENLVSNANFSPDGQHLVTASDDNTAKIWRLVDGQWQKKATIEHEDWVSNASFSPDGQHLVTASNDETAKIWGLVNDQWQGKATIQHNEWVDNVSFSPDGQHLVTTSLDKTAKIWGLVDGQWQEKAKIMHDKWVNNASFSPDGHHLVTASDDKTAKIWGLVNGLWQEKATIKHHNEVKNASFSPDGHHLVTASDDKTAKIWGLVNGLWQEKATIKHHSKVRNVCFSPNGHYLVTTSRDNTTKIWLVKKK